MTLADYFKEISGNDPNKSVWEIFTDLYDYKKPPIRDKKLLELCVEEISNKPNAEKAREWLSILKHLKKEEDFDPAFLSTYFRARNSSLNHSAVNALRYSQNEKVQNTLLGIIEKPKSDDLGVTAVNLLLYELTSQELFSRLISIYPKLKKETKRSTRYLIYTKSFDNRLNQCNELEKFLNTINVKSLRKWSFKNWKYLSRESATDKLLNRLTKVWNTTSKKGFKNELFYIPISSLSYIMIRAHFDFENNEKVKIDIGERSFIKAFHGILSYELSSSFSSTNQGMMSVDLDHDEIESILSDAEDNLRKMEIYLEKNYKVHNLNTDKKSLFPIASFITYSLFKNDLENAEKWANYWMNDNEEWLQEYWLRFCKELNQVIIANTGYDGMPPIVSTST